MSYPAASHVITTTPAIHVMCQGAATTPTHALRIPTLLATLMSQGWEASRCKEPRRLTIKRNAMRGRDREKAATQIVDVTSSDVAVMNGCTRYTPSTMRPA